MRATSFDQEAALAQGINVGRIFGLVWFIAGILAAFAGFFITGGFNTLSQLSFVCIKSTTSSSNWWTRLYSWCSSWFFNYWINTRICCLLSNSFRRIVGISLGNGFSLLAPYLIMFVILIFKPDGLFGTEEVERV